ncbi:hypothetical protein A2635_03385 [Candidatus Peribacteria bacterium RIFCSPHIGHO2_01_FULL_51_9]|nr:MAG: hypothetical protein A2635_03385 [Candidatus Peribacteria bacterium RIFCSPHIGHO2_01_FULL_51_9]
MSKQQSLEQLLQNAAGEGNVSASTLQAIQVVDLGAQIQQGLGISVDDVMASETVLVTLMPDDSGSIEAAGNAQLVRDGHNLVLESLTGSKKKDGVLVHTRYLNGRVLFPYCPLDQAVRMDGRNYRPSLGTPLYDQSVVVLSTVLVKAQEFLDGGVPCRTVTFFITDGRDEHSQSQTPRTVKALVDDMLRTENHIIGGMFIDDGVTNGRKIFRDMGIRDQWILTPKNTSSEIRRAFNVVSQSAVRASQGAQSFSQTAAGGFGK